MTSPDVAEFAVVRRRATATAPAGIDVYSAVGDHRAAQAGAVVRVHQALDLSAKVTVTVTGRSPVGTDRAELVIGGDGGPAVAAAVNGVRVLMDRYRRLAPKSPLPAVSVDAEAAAPVSAGLAGDEAAVAAAMTATREILHGPGAAEAGFALAPRPSDAELRELSAAVDDRVAVSLLGGTSLDTGDGGLVPMMSRGVRHWALALDRRALEPEAVLERLDEQRQAAARGERPDIRAGDVTAVQRALLTDNPTELAEVLASDLQAAVLSLRPELRRTLAVARESGALGAVVSGTGPAVAVLCSDRDHAVEVATALSVAGQTGPTLVAASSPHGARLIP